MNARDAASPKAVPPPALTEPVEDYLKVQKRFSHLFGTKGEPATVAAIQAMADANIRRFGLAQPVSA